MDKGTDIFEAVNWGLSRGLDSRVAVIDGSNFLFGAGDRVRLAPLLTLVGFLWHVSTEVVVFFDANVLEVLLRRESSLASAILQQLCLRHPTGFRVVDRGVQADTEILLFALQRRAVIWSNDKFRDHATETEYRAKFGVAPLRCIITEDTIRINGNRFFSIPILKDLQALAAQWDVRLVVAPLPGTTTFETAVAPSSTEQTSEVWGTVVQHIADQVLVRLRTTTTPVLADCSTVPLPDIGSVVAVSGLVLDPSGAFLSARVVHRAG